MKRLISAFAAVFVMTLCLTPAWGAEPEQHVFDNADIFTDAEEAELDMLPGIGPVLAQRIVEYRQANGPFAATEEIMQVDGIGESTYAELQDLITVGEA